jgi:hypothetical protein
MQDDSGGIMESIDIGLWISNFLVVWYQSAWMKYIGDHFPILDLRQKVPIKVYISLVVYQEAFPPMEGHLRHTELQSG